MKLARFRFAPIPFLIGLCVAALVAWAISYFSGFGFWPAFGIAVVALLINGIIAETEDNAPGGFNNPLPPRKTAPLPDDANDKTRND